MIKNADEIIDKLMEISESDWHSTAVIPPMWASDEEVRRVYRSQTLLIALTSGEFVIGWHEMTPGTGKDAGLAEFGWAYIAPEFGFTFLKRQDIIAWMELPNLLEAKEEAQHDTTRTI